MAKRSFTTRLDEDVLAQAQRLAEAQRRSVTSIIELAVLEYARKYEAEKSSGADRVSPPVQEPERSNERDP